jgi:hypothetical protein
MELSLGHFPEIHRITVRCFDSFYSSRATALRWYDTKVNDASSELLSFSFNDVSLLVTLPFLGVLLAIALLR